MAKPIMPDPILRGRAARKFERIFLLNTKPDAKKTERNKKDLELYRANKVVNECDRELIEEDKEE